MRLLFVAALALLALLCLLPAALTPSGPLVSAAAAKKPAAAAASAYVAANRDLEEEEEEQDDDDVPAPRSSGSSSSQQQQQRVSSRASEEEEESDERSDASPMLLRLTLEHSFDSAAFTRRGDVTVNFNPARGAKALSFSTPQTGSKKAAAAALQANPSALYRLRFVQEGQNADESIMASIPLVRT